MSKYDIGDIVFVSEYNYDNGEKGSNHLFVIIDKDTYVTAEYFGLIVSSNTKKSTFKFNERIRKNTTNNLNVDSIVKCDQLYNIKEKYIQFRIGHVDVDDFMRFLRSYNEYLKTLEKEKQTV